MRKINIRKFIYGFFRGITGLGAAFAAYFLAQALSAGGISTEAGYKGIINVYDLKLPTVLGNDYSVITTLCEEYSVTVKGCLFRPGKINDITPEESYIHAVPSADIIRYGEDLPEHVIMRDEDFTSRLRCDFYDVPAPYDNGRVVVPYCYDVYVMIINRRIFPDEEFGEMNIEEIMSFAEERDTDILYSDSRIMNIFTDEKYPSCCHGIAEIITEGDIEGFISAHGGIMFGSLSDVKILLRYEAKGRAYPEYDVYFIPAGEGRDDCLYIRDIYSYAAKECEDTKKRDAVLSFMEYLQESSAVCYTENLGLLPWYGAEEVGYEKYPVLRKFAVFEGRRVMVE